MKLAGKAIDGFLKSPPAEIAAVLIYGPDAGLVKERADHLTQLVAGSLEDPFRVALLDARTLAADPARLADEAMALAFGGGRRAIRIADADDPLAPLLEALLKEMAGDSLVILEAAELAPRSALRKLFEPAKRGAALACYRDEGPALGALIRERMKQEGLAIAPEAVDWLAARLGSDRGITARELEKLALYVGPGSGKRVELADAAAATGDSAYLALEDFLYALGDSDLAALDRALTRNLAEGASPIGLLRAAARHFIGLQSVAARVAGGEPMADAMRSLRPPIFFKYEERYRRQLRRWSGAGLARALDRLTQTEQRCKLPGAARAELLCRQAFIDIAGLPDGAR